MVVVGLPVKILAKNQSEKELELGVIPCEETEIYIIYTWLVTGFEQVEMIVNLLQE